MAFVDLEKNLTECLKRSSGGRWENLMWRSGLYDWCRGCMPMSGAMSVLVRGTEKCLKWRLVFTNAQYSACYSSSLCLMPCLVSSALGSPGKTSMQMTLLSSLNHLKNVTGGSWLVKEAMEEKGLRVNAKKTKDHDLWYGPGSPAEFRRVYMSRLLL